MELTALDPELLPPIAYAYPEGVDLPDPDSFVPVKNLLDLNRPEFGLWCSPVTAWADDGTPASTAWTDWCETPDSTGLTHLHHETLTPYSRMVAVEPAPGARIYAIDTEEDLDRLVAAFTLPQDMAKHQTAPDWEAMARAGWDAVYASAEGIAANGERFVTAVPSLFGWECASVLWLRPAYRLTGP